MLTLRLEKARRYMPADTAIGEFDLPCADVVLYADGHVKTNRKDPAAP